MIYVYAIMSVLCITLYRMVAVGMNYGNDVEYNLIDGNGINCK